MSSLSENARLWSSLHWWIFAVIVFVLLSLDLLVFHRKPQKLTFKQASFWTAFWAMIAGTFNAYVFLASTPEKGLEFLTAYLVEWSLSVDNVFVFSVVFTFFKVPDKNQHRILFWGIIGAVVMRFIFIFGGIELIKHFHTIMYFFGAFLIYTGIKLSMKQDDDIDPNQNIVMRIAKKIFPVAEGPIYDRFFVKIGGKRYLTTAFLVLLVIESSDVLFAIDSVPAVIGISRDSYIIYTSNIFAILGLRALYFLLAGVIKMFRYLNYALSAILVFVGIKMIGEQFFNHHDGTHFISPGMSLVTILSLLLVAIIASIWANRRSLKP